MAIDVLDLRAFYASPLGHVAHRFVSQAIVSAWREPRGMRVLGIGYAPPYLSLWRDSAERLIAFMPAAQGVLHWPRPGASATALVDPADLPLPDASIDRALIVHALEMSHHPHDMLAEAWRVLAPGGRLLLVVPNRRGLWARMDTTPFGEGRPFSRSQLTTLLRETLFSPESWREALFVPPIPRRLFLRGAAAWEKLGGRLLLPGAGVLVIDATKQLYRPVPARPARNSAWRLRPVLSPAALPAPRTGEAQSAP
jgi:SAM-dependent methyltransferase